MTVGKMRRLMLEKVVPEKLIPQNIAEFLVDENAELAELDAYTFLTRLRGLGVGSADFRYLLEGCGAPDAALEKIKSNPAMNLQSLILTLDNSGMTSKDYMRILYTARQIWERTRTTRLEAAQAASDESLAETYSENDAENESVGVSENESNAESSFEENDSADTDGIDDDEFGAALRSLAEETEKALREQEAAKQTSSEDNPFSFENETENPNEQAVYEKQEASNSADNDNSEDISADIQGFSLGATEEFESLLGGNSSDDYAKPAPRIEDEDFDTSVFPEEITGGEAVTDEYLDEQNIIEPANADDFVKENKHFTVQIDYSALNEAYMAAAEQAAENMQSDENDAAYKLENNVEADNSESIADRTSDGNEQTDNPVASYNGDTTAIVKIDRTLLEENLANLAKNAETSSDDEEQRQDAAADDTVTDDGDAQNKQKEKFEVKIVDDDYNENYDYINSRSRYYVGELAFAAAGAAVVAGCGVIAGIVFGMAPPEPIGYAADENEIFTEIYYAYSEKITGGDSYYGYSAENMEIFGDLLVKQDGFPTFTDGENVYSITSEEITINKLSGNALEYVGTISAVENTSIVDAVQLDDGSLAAVFDGDVCGFLKVSGGTLSYTVRQDGHLTDFFVENGEIRLGSVYTPKFYQNFTAADVQIYLPKVGTDYAAMLPQNVILSETRGYSYGVSAAYSAENGKTLRADAVIGNPVYASGNGYFAVNGAETGMLLRVDYSQVREENPAASVYTEECGRLSDIAFFNGGSAALESGNIILRDGAFKSCAMLENLSGIPNDMEFFGNVLAVSDKNKVFLTMDCSEIANPQPIVLRSVVGMTDNGCAVTMEQTADGILVSDYIIGNDGKAQLRYSNLLNLSGEQRGSLDIAGAKSIVAGSGLTGAAYSYFDGVSVIWEFVLLGEAPKRAMLYDDKTGVTLAFAMGDKVYIQCAKGLIEMS